MRRLIMSFVLVWLLVSAAVANGNVTRKSFPKGFVFGTATSAYQVEGMARKDGRGPSIWDPFVKIPGIISNNATADIAADQYHRYKEDIDLMKKLNFDAYRFSISWSRIFPEGNGKVNYKGVAYYNHLISYMVEKGITPYVTLNHFDLPQALEEKYLGWLGDEVVKDFADYAEFCFKTFGDRVKNWMTLNEPRGVAVYGYGKGIIAPGRCSKAYGNCRAGNSMHEPYIAAHNMILSHAAAVQRYRQKYQEKQRGRIGIPLDFAWYEPLTKSKADNYAAQRVRDFHIGWFLHPLVYGEYPKTMENLIKDRLPKFTKEEVKFVKGSFDFVGLNQYTAYYVYKTEINTSKDIGYEIDRLAGLAYERNGKPIGQRANSFWLYNVPWGLYKSITYIKQRYGNPTIIVTENGDSKLSPKYMITAVNLHVIGMDDPGNITLSKGLHDTTRINYYKGYLAALKQAIDEGAHVIGYFAWSLLDNFEWTSGYTSRFGIVYVDFKTLKRYPKMSALWFKKILQRNKH